MAYGNRITFMEAMIVLETGTKKRLIDAINTVNKLEDYKSEDCIFSEKYGISSVKMIYILKKLEEDFAFKMDDKFIDSMEMCTFSQFEKLLEEYENTKTFQSNS